MLLSTQLLLHTHGTLAPTVSLIFHPHHGEEKIFLPIAEIYIYQKNHDVSQNHWGYIVVFRINYFSSSTTSPKL